MADNKTRPTTTTIDAFLRTVSDKRRIEAIQLIDIFKTISGLNPLMWGPSIIGFGNKHYKYESGREGDVPQISFSPRKNAVTIYFLEGFNEYGEELNELGKFKNSSSCLYVNKIDDINIDVLIIMLEKSFKKNSTDIKKPKTVEEYIDLIPESSRKQFDRLRLIIKKTIPTAEENINYGVIGYKIKDKRAFVFISGWKDHVAIYPVPKNKDTQLGLEKYIKGGSLWFSLGKELPVEAIKKTIYELAKK